MTLPDFYDLLNRTDWTYEMSDDPRSYRRGADAMAVVQKAANESEEHKKLYGAFFAYAWRGADKPLRPAVEFVSGLSDIKAGG